MKVEVALWLAAAQTLVLSCGGGGNSAVDNFSSTYATEISEDCRQSVQCLAQRGQTTGPDPVQNCPKDTGAMLDGNAAAQMAFLTNYERCRQYVVCDYFDCATSGVSSYGDTQIDKVSRNCQEDIDCQIMRGTFQGDQTSALANCIAINLGTIEAFSPDQRRNYESTYETCAMMNACDFTNCFPF